MLTQAQSVTIARRSIKALSGIPVKDIRDSHTLDRLTISDDLRVRLVKRLAIESEEFGVKKFNHTLAIEDLDAIDSSSTVGEFAQAIKDNAVGSDEEEA
jgi:hypothetical protein